MAVRMVLVGGRRPEMGTEDHGNVGNDIADAVEGIGEHRLAVSEDARLRP